MNDISGVICFVVVWEHTLKFMRTKKEFLDNVFIAFEKEKSAN